MHPETPCMSPEWNQKRKSLGALLGKTKKLYTKSNEESRHITLVVFFLVRFLGLLRGLLELLLPHLVGSVLVQVGKQDVEHFGVPARGMAFDAFFDVLQDVRFQLGEELIDMMLT